MTLTSLNGVYLSNEINRFFPMNGKVTVNATIQLLENDYTKSPVVKKDVQTKLIEVIQVSIQWVKLNGTSQLVMYMYRSLQTPHSFLL